MSLTISWPLDSTKWRPKGSVEFSLDHVTFGFGLPSVAHLNMAVWLALTAIPTGRSKKDGAERDCLGSPLAPFTPDGPVSPDVPFYSFRPLSSYWSMFARRSVWAWFPWGTRFSPSSHFASKSDPVTFWSWAAECVILSKESVLQ